MTKKDYELIASALSHAKPIVALTDPQMIQWNVDVATIADRLQSANPRFNHAKFLKATEA